MIRNLFFYFLIALIATSCVPSSKVVYLQKDNELEEEGILDTVVRDYKIVDFNYRLRPRDVVSIKVSSLTPNEYNFFSNFEKELEAREPLLSGFVLDENGYIEMPVVGKVKLAGLTIDEAHNKVRELAGGYLYSPSVNVRLLSYHFTILGEVNLPGKYTTYNSNINIIEAIATAGDLTDFADRSKVKVIRYEDGEAKILYVNLLDENLLTSSNYYLRPNDIINIAPLGVKNYKLFQSSNVSLVISTLTLFTLIFTRF